MLLEPLLTISLRPLIPGHEIIGEVVALGSGEKNWKVDDRVGGPWHGGHDGEDTAPDVIHWLLKASRYMQAVPAWSLPDVHE